MPRTVTSVWGRRGVSLACFSAASLAALTAFSQTTQSVSVSGSSASGHAAEQATDGDYSTYWQPGEPESPLSLALETPARITSLEIDWADQGPDWRWVEVHVSYDGSTFMEIANQLATGYGEMQLPLTTSEGVRALRVVLSEGEGPSGISELRVDGFPSSSDSGTTDPGDDGSTAPGDDANPTPTAPSDDGSSEPTGDVATVTEVISSGYVEGGNDDYVNDGNPDTRWRPEAGSSGYLVLELAELTTVSALAINFDESQGRSYDFTVSASDGGPMTGVAGYTSSGANAGFETFLLPGPTSALEIRLDIDALPEGATIEVRDVRVLGLGSATGVADGDDDTPTPDPEPPIGSTDPADPLPGADPVPPADDDVAALRTVHVSPNGSASAAGTEADPLNSIASALTAIQPGDEVIVHGGTWTQPLELTTSGTSEAPIQFTARDGAVLDFTQASGIRAAILVSASHLRIRGFDIRGPVTGIEIGDGLYPLADVCADVEGFHRGRPEEDRSSFNCTNHPTSNLVVSDVIIDGRKTDGSRALIDLATGPTEWNLGVAVFDEAENITIRNYEMANMRHGVFADGQEQVRRIANLTMENLYIHDTRNYGIRIIARETFIATEDAGGNYWQWHESGVPRRVRVEENTNRHQYISNLVLRDSVLHRNGFTDASTGEGYGNMLIQGIQGGIIERNTFSDGPYWGIDALVCNDILYRNNVFYVSESVAQGDRRWPSPEATWPLVGLEVNGGERNRVYNNSFWGFETGLFESLFPEDFVLDTLSVDVQNNLFWHNQTAIQRFPAVAWLQNASAVTPNYSMQFVPVSGFSITRNESYNSMESGINMSLVGGQLQQFLLGDPEFFGSQNSVLTTSSPFVNGSAGNLRQTAGAASIDSANTLNAVQVGRAGTARPQGNGYDRGAYERGSN